MVFFSFIYILFFFSFKGNHFHIVVFNLQGQALYHYRCYQQKVFSSYFQLIFIFQKVSRCTSLKINSEGHIVTMSRQNSAVIGGEFLKKKFFLSFILNFELKNNFFSV